MRTNPIGPETCDIMIVGEFPGRDEESTGLPFHGSADWELKKMLKEAGINPDSCYRTLAVKVRPAGNDVSIWISEKRKPKDDEIIFNGYSVRNFILEELRELKAEICKVKPKVIIALGNVGLWATTGERSVDKWRGSHLTTLDDIGHKCWVVPTYAPLGIIRNYKWRFIAVQDFRRALRRVSSPLAEVNFTEKWGVIIRPSYGDCRMWLKGVWDRLEKEKVTVICDLEIKENRIVCMGLSASDNSAICIPFLTNSGFYWENIAEEVSVIEMFRAIVYHPNCRLANQNIAFDIQFLWKDWAIWPPAAYDTMIAQAVIFPGSPASLDYLASVYCEHYVYWKDDGKFWKEFVEDERLWKYNCLDAIYTRQVMNAQVKVLSDLRLTENAEWQFRILRHVIKMMHRGVKVDLQRKGEFFFELNKIIGTLRAELQYLTDVDLWAEKGFSNTKLSNFFYSEMKLPLVTNPKTKSPTCDDEAMKKFIKMAPWLRPVCERINVIRSYGTALTVCLAKTDRDGRWRCSYRVAGTETLRFKSSENPMGSGTNLQNITLGRNILEEVQ